MNLEQLPAAGMLPTTNHIEVKASSMKVQHEGANKHITPLQSEEYCDMSPRDAPAQLSLRGTIVAALAAVASAFLYLLASPRHDLSACLPVVDLQCHALSKHDHVEQQHLAGVIPARLQRRFREH